MPLIKNLCCLICSFFLVIVHISAQRIIYAEPTKAQLHDLNEIELLKYEIIGNYSGNVLIYKSLRKGNVICIYNAEMKEVDRVVLDFLPQKVLNIDFVAYSNFCWMFYSFQTEKNIYSIAVKLGVDGRIIGQPIQLDKMDAQNMVGVKWYTVLKSENKQKLMLLKANAINSRQAVIKMMLFDNDLKLLHSSQLLFPIDYSNEVLSEFTLNNDGILVFGKSARENINDGVAKFYLEEKLPDEEVIKTHAINLDNVLLDNVKIKVDNLHKNYLLTSFYFNKKFKDGIKGMFYTVWNWQTEEATTTENIPLDSLLNIKTKEGNDVKLNIDHFYLQHILVRKDGGALLTAEDVYYGLSPKDNARANVFYPDRGIFFNFLSYRYNANKIAIFSFDKNGKLEWNNIINKTQYAASIDGGDKILSYQLLNTGDGIQFFYNDFGNHPFILNNQLLDATGKLGQLSTPRGIIKKYVLMPRFAKQTDLKEMIVPCFYRNFLTFAKIAL